MGQVKGANASIRFHPIQTYFVMAVAAHPILVMAVMGSGGDLCSQAIPYVSF